MEKVLFLSNIPSPYRIDFFNKLGEKIDVTVIFEAKQAKGISFNWNLHDIKNFRAIFLKEGNIEEKKIDWGIIKQIKAHEYDRIILTNYAYFTEMLGLIYLKIKRIPFILEIDGGIIKKENFFKYKLKKFLITSAEEYFSPSKESDKYLKHYGAKENEIYRYPFSSLSIKDLTYENDRDTLRKEFGVENKFVLIGVGQFIRRKGFDILIESIKYLKNQELLVYIIGGLPTPEYKEIIERYNISNVRFESFKSKEELDKHFKMSDLFVLPTREDVWGLVINEAMAYGLPVITTEKCIAGLELIEDGVNGYIIPIDNPEVLSERILKIMKDIELRDYISKNNIKKIRNYTIETMVDKHYELILKNK